MTHVIDRGQTVEATSYVSGPRWVDIAGTLLILASRYRTVNVAILSERKGLFRKTVVFHVAGTPEEVNAWCDAAIAAFTG